jgi:uncharacterized protein YcbK (DUF882 family)
MKEITASSTGISRRTFLRVLAGTAIGLALMSPLDVLARPTSSGNLSFYHTHTGEQFQLCIVNGQCTTPNRKAISTFLRDFRTGDIHAIDIELFAILQKIQQMSGSNGVFEVISGYRSPKTNAILNSRSRGVARRSYHMKGRAIDIRLSDLRTKDLRDIALDLRTGGVGYYRKSDFVHLDTGPVRFW